MQFLKSLFIFFVLTSALCSSVRAQSSPLEKPGNAVILSLTGKIAATNSGKQALFDRQMLEALPQHEVTTYTPWTEGKHTYQGVLLSELLAYLGAYGVDIKAVALDDFSAHLPMEEVRQYPVLLALKKDDKVMRVRNKGPIWIIYPLSDYPEIDNVVYHDRMVWQLSNIEVN